MNRSVTSVVVPVDFSDDSLAAVDAGLQFVDDPTQLHVIHVLRDVTAGELEHMWDDEHASQWESRAEQKLRECLSDDKYRGVHLEVVFGDPAESIAQCAVRVGADLIVMPSHGRRGLPRLLLGSVTERVMRLAHCSVLILKRGESP